MQFKQIYYQMEG